MSRRDRLRARFRVGGAGPVGSSAPVADGFHRELRSLARRLHPDLGGDEAEYVQAVSELRHRHGLDAPAVAAGPTTGGRNGAAPKRLSRRAVRRAVRAGRARLPRRMPGSRRYVSL